MLGVYQYAPALFENQGLTNLTYKAGDTNGSVVKMWKAAQNGWKPPTTCSQNEYERLHKKTKSDASKGFIGHQFSFGGKYFQGYSGRMKGTEASKRVSNISKELYDVKFTPGSYEQFSRLKGYVIYCDPPYARYNKYYDEERHELKFDTRKFLDWCKRMNEHNIVFVSEYRVPSKDFTQIYRQKHSSNHCGQQGANYDKLCVVKV
jgi:hypothetical protein